MKTKNIEFLSEMELLSKSTDELIAIAKDLSNRGDNEFAFLVLQHLLGQDPDNTHGLNQLGLVCMQLQKFSIAIDALESLIALQPKLSSAYVLLAGVYSKLGEKELALGAITKGINRISEDDELLGYCYALRGAFYLALGDMENFKKDLITASEIQPDLDLHENIRVCQQCALKENKTLE